MDIDKVRLNAEAGNTVSQGFLGAFYLYGEGVPVDYAEAFKWLSIAAEKGAFLPIANLGYMYEQGFGVPKDMAEALRLYKDAACRGNSGSAILLARMYSQGQGVAADPDEALRWFLVIMSHPHIEEPSDVRREASDYIMATPDVESKLIPLLHSDPVTLARAGAAIMLGRLDVASVIPVLVEAAADASVTVRYHAVAALGEFVEWDDAGVPVKEAVTQFLLHTSQDVEDDIRAIAIYSLVQGDHDTDETHNRLWAALDDPCPEARGHAAYGLSLYGGQEIVQRLDDLLRSDPAPPDRYFDAAEELEDPSLLPAVLIGAERSRKSLPKYEAEYPGVQSAIDRLSSLGV